MRLQQSEFITGCYRAVQIVNRAKVNLVSAEKSTISSNEAKIAKIKTRLSLIPESAPKV